ncbi:MAG: sugar phosphate isomerase/epimerase [Verrucomicrobiota bacterium]
MTLGIFAKTFARPSVEEVFDSVAHYGLRWVQFNFACAGLPSMPDQLNPELLDRIRRAATGRQVAIAAVSGTFNMIHPDKLQQREGIWRLRVLASACSEIDAPIITLCTGTRDLENMWRRHPDNDLADAWLDLVGAMSQAVTIAEEFNLTLGIEPEVGNVVDSAPKARRLLDEIQSPRLKIVMDGANLFHAHELPRMREIMDEAFELLGRDIVLAHAKELGVDGHAGGLALGSGVLDWDHYLALLIEAYYKGPLIMHGIDERDITASVNFLRQHLPTTGCD